MDDSDFQRAISKTVRAAAKPAIDAGAAQLDEGVDDGGPHLRLTPTNERACELSVYFDYPTIGLAEGTTEMFGPQEQRLHELALLVKAVVAGRYEWEFGKGRAFGCIPMKRFRGTFHTEEGPWTFTRWGSAAEPDAARGDYEPYF